VAQIPIRAFLISGSETAAPAQNTISLPADIKAKS
jgi:hypothetical protein